MYLLLLILNCVALALNALLLAAAIYGPLRNESRSWKVKQAVLVGLLLLCSVLSLHDFLRTLS